MYDLASTWQKEEKWQKFFSEGIILSFRTSSSDLWVVSDGNIRQCQSRSLHVQTEEHTKNIFLFEWNHILYAGTNSYEFY